MPELPEVETIRRQLAGKLVGKRISVVEVRYPKAIHGTSASAFAGLLKGKKIIDIGRQGKLILIRLEGGKTLVIHLKLTGRLLLQFASHPERSPAKRGGVEGSRAAIDKSTEVIFRFIDGTTLLYDDIRRFGYLKVVPTKEEARVVQKEKLGVDFFDPALTPDRFITLLRTRSGVQIKPLLMDQSLISGIGNIYAQEACFAAHIYPVRKAKTLTVHELKELHRALKEVMKKAMQYRGSSVDAYVDAYGKEGGFVPYLKVYGREGKPCPRCSSTLEKSTIGGRGTVYCGKCQK